MVQHLQEILLDVVSSHLIVSAVQRLLTVEQYHSIELLMNIIAKRQILSGDNIATQSTSASGGAGSIVVANGQASAGNTIL